MVNTTSQTEPPSKEELTEAESKDKLEIVKQIKKVNDDGSYTIGYEADDGSFKIESRDVQGNIKGTYGYVDDDGEVKRVTYSTKNTSRELVSVHEPVTSVVQRIPRIERTSTKMPSTYSTPPTVASSTTVVQSIPRRRIPPTTSTIKINQTVDNEKPRVSPTVIVHQNSHTSASQIVRPEFATRRPAGTSLNEGIKPVTESSEIHGNLLRRQTFDVQQHATNLRQTHGADAPDVYTASVTTGMPRPLFTTIRPATVESTSARYTPIYSRNIVTPEVTTLSPSTQESVTTGATPQTSTPVSVQIPQNQLEPLVAIRHPYRGTIIVPLRELQNQQEQVHAYNRPQQVYSPNEQFQPEPDPRTVPVYVRRPPIPVLRSMPVQVDENGFVRELRPIPAYAHPEPQYLGEEENSINEIDGIKPPVSVQDFQKLLNLLLNRQRKLEQVNRLAVMRNLGQQYENIYQAAAPVPYVASKYEQRGPVQFIPQDASKERQVDPQQYRRIIYTPQPNFNQYQQPNRRVARLLKPEREEYLPPDVREMLLLRMLQLAINPALPVDDIETLGSSTNVQMTRQPVRNVEILGEEDDEEKRMRVKRFPQES